MVLVLTPHITANIQSFNPSPVTPPMIIPRRKFSSSPPLYHSSSSPLHMHSKMHGFSPPPTSRPTSRVLVLYMRIPRRRFSSSLPLHPSSSSPPHMTSNHMVLFLTPHITANIHSFSPSLHTWCLAAGFFNPFFSVLSQVLPHAFEDTWF